MCDALCGVRCAVWWRAGAALAVPYSFGGGAAGPLSPLAQLRTVPRLARFHHPPCLRAHTHRFAYLRTERHAYGSSAYVRAFVCSDTWRNTREALIALARLEATRLLREQRQAQLAAIGGAAAAAGAGAAAAAADEGGQSVRFDVGAAAAVAGAGAGGEERKVASPRSALKQAGASTSSTPKRVGGIGRSMTARVVATLKGDHADDDDDAVDGGGEEALTEAEAQATREIEGAAANPDDQSLYWAWVQLARIGTDAEVRALFTQLKTRTPNEALVAAGARRLLAAINCVQERLVQTKASFSAARAARVHAQLERAQQLQQLQQQQPADGAAAVAAAVAAAAAAAVPAAAVNPNEQKGAPDGVLSDRAFVYLLLSTLARHLCVAVHADCWPLVVSLHGHNECCAYDCGVVCAAAEQSGGAVGRQRRGVGDVFGAAAAAAHARRPH